jgi:hypothetical protein
MGAAIIDLILVPHCIAQRHLLPDLLTVIGSNAVLMVHVQRKLRGYIIF